MRRTPAFAIALLALTAPVAGAGTPAWVTTFVSENGTRTYVESIRSGTVAAVVGGNLVVSNDFGQTWVPSVLGPPNGGSTETRVAVSTPTRWFSENGSVVAVTNDAGTTWKQLTVAPRVIKEKTESWEFATEVAAVDGAPAAAVGWNAIRVRGGCPYATSITPLYVTRDGGTRWKRTDLPVEGDVESIEWLDARHAVATVVERDWTEPEHDGNGTCESEGTFVANSIWVTSDGGQTWRRVLRTQEWWTSAAWVDPKTIVVIGESKGVARSYVSIDAGRSFRKPVQVYTTPGGVNGFPTVEFVEGRRGWVGAILAGVYRTDNGGSEWTHEVSPGDGAFYGVPELTAMNRDRAVFAGPSALITRIGEVGAALPASALVPAVPRIASVATTSFDGVTATFTRPSFGPPTATLRVAR